MREGGWEGRGGEGRGRKGGHACEERAGQGPGARARWCWSRRLHSHHPLLPPHIQLTRPAVPAAARRVQGGQVAARAAPGGRGQGDGGERGQDQGRACGRGGGEEKKVGERAKGLGSRHGGRGVRACGGRVPAPPARGHARARARVKGGAPLVSASRRDRCPSRRGRVSDPQTAASTVYTQNDRCSVCVCARPLCWLARAAGASRPAPPPSHASHARRITLPTTLLDRPTPQGTALEASRPASFPQTLDTAHPSRAHVRTRRANGGGGGVPQVSAPSPTPFRRPPRRRAENREATGESAAAADRPAAARRASAFEVVPATAAGERGDEASGSWSEDGLMAPKGGVWLVCVDRGAAWALADIESSGSSGRAERGRAFFSTRPCPSSLSSPVPRARAAGIPSCRRCRDRLDKRAHSLCARLYRKLFWACALPEASASGSRVRDGRLSQPAPLLVFSLSRSHLLRPTSRRRSPSLHIHSGAHACANKRGHRGQGKASTRSSHALQRHTVRPASSLTPSSPPGQHPTPPHISQRQTRQADRLALGFQSRAAHSVTVRQHRM